MLVGGHARAVSMTWLVTGLALGLSLAPLTPARAANELQFQASVDRQQVPLNGTLTLTLSVNIPDRSRNYEMQLPNTGTLKKIGSRSSTGTQISFSGGATRAVVTENTILTLKPTSVGYTTIGPASVRYRGELYKTKPIRVQVTKASQQPQGQRRPSAGRFPSMMDDDWFRSPFDDMFRSPFDDMRRTPEPVAENALFVKAIATPTRVVENQQVTLSVVIYSLVGGRVEPVRWPKLDGFYSVERDVSEARTQEQVIDGVTYQVKLLARKALFPLHAGEMNIDPVEVEVELGRSPFFPSETRLLKTRPIQIEVVDLPEQGRPTGFSPANVGVYHLSASVDSSRVKLNQPVTFRVEVEGAGNIQRLRPPALPQLDRFKMFDPTVNVQVADKGEQVRGSKSFETILLPLSSGTLTIPELTFSYYDLEEKQYRTLRTEPQPIEVEAAGDSPTASGTNTAGKEVNVLAGGFKPIRYQSELGGVGAPFYSSELFVPLLLFPPGLYLLILIGSWLRGLLQLDSPRLRMRRSMAASKQALRRSRRLLADGQADAFYATLKSSLLNLVESLLGVPGQGLTMSEMRKRLTDIGLPAEQTEIVVGEIENCDFGQFAPSVRRGEEMQSALERVTALLKNVKKPRTRPGHRERNA
jgi:hypothetical protein